MKKRGQITYFIVLGLLLLMGLLFFLFQQRTVQSEVVESTLIPAEVLPVREFIQDCIDRTGEEAIVLLGEQGGYLYFPPYIEKDRFSYVSPNGFTKVPYWYFQGRTRLPAILDMQADLDRYVNENLPNCLNNFEAFDEKFEVKVLTPISTASSIQNVDVLLDVEYGVEVTRRRDRDTYYLKNFKSTLPARIKRLHEFAALMLQVENEKLFLENVTLDLMAMNKNVPFSGLDFSCREKRWFMRDIQSEVAGTLESQLPLLRFKNTRHRPFRAETFEYEKLREYTVEDIYNGDYPENPPRDRYQYFHYYIDLSDDDYSDIGVRVQYDADWGLDIQARPDDGGVLRSNSGKADQLYLRFLCFQFHHFTYDVRYPVVISVRDDLSFNGEGLVMKFATPVQLIRNKPDREDKGIDFFPIGDSVPDSCTLDGDAIDIRVKGEVSGFANVDLDGVNVTYDCLSYQCDLGQTKADRGIFRLRTNLPSGCSGGYLVAEKEGYLPAREQVLGEFMQVPLVALKTMNVQAVKHATTNLNVEKPLDTWDSVVLSIRNEEHDYVFYGDITANEPIELEFLATDATYFADIILYDNVDEIMYGGYKSNFTLTEDMLNGGETLILHVAEYLPKPLNDEGLFDVIGYLNDRDYVQELAPEVR